MAQVRTIYRGGSRFYVHPEQRDVQHPGVTSIIDMLPKPFLQPWAAKMTAELAVDSLSFVQQMAERDRDGAVDYLKGASRRYTKVRSGIGSEAHDLFERLIRGEHVGRVRADLEPYVLHFREFLAAANPEFVRAEDIAWSDTHGYAGSFDIIMYVWLDEKGHVTPDRSGKRHLVIGDWKTSKDVHAEVSLQLTAYAKADFVIDPDGNREPMPDIEGGFVLHVTAAKWALHPVEVSDEVFTHFLNLRRVFEWNRDVSKRVIGKPLLGNGRIITGTQRRA